MASTASKDLIVITCAAGRQCAFLVPRLYGKPTFNLRLVVQSQTSKEKLLQQCPEADVVQTDLASPENCRSVLRDATHVFYIGPSLHRYEKEMGLFMIDAATIESSRPGNRFRHFIYSSVMNTQFRSMYNHDRKRYVEESLFESPLNYTVLQPCDFLNMAFPVSMIQAMDKPGYHSLMGLESKSAFTVLEDYAEACEKIIDQGPAHYFAQYHMASMMPIAYGEAARDLGRMMGFTNDSEFPVTQMPLQDAVDFLCRVVFGSVNCGSRERDGCEALETFYRRRGLQGNPNTMGWILGRKPTSHTEWFAQQLEK